MSGQYASVDQRIHTVWIVEGTPGEGGQVALALAVAPALACEVLATVGAALDRLAAGEAPAVLVLGRDGAERAGPERADLDACGRIRAMRDPHQLPILLVLAHRDSESVARGLAAGANDCLGEPYVSAELVARVTSLASSQRLYRRAVDAELERQGLLEAIFAQPMVRVAVLRGPELVFEMASSGYVEYYGRERDFIGRPLREAFPEHDGGPFVPRLLDVMATGVPYVSGERTTHFDRGDGVHVPVHFSAVYQPLRGKSGQIDGVLVVGNDITEAVNARRELQAARARLQQFIEQAPAVIALLDGPEHRYMLANEMYRQLVGNRELLGRSVAEALPEVVEQGFITLLDNVYRTGVAYRATETWLKLQKSADGPLEDACMSFVYQPVVGSGGSVESIFVHAVEVTDMVRAREQARRAAIEREGAYDVLEHGDPTFIVDADWRFTFANAAWLRWIGRRREAVLGELMWDLFTQGADSAGEFRATYHRAMHERVPVQLTHHDAPTHRWVWLSLHPTTDGGLATFIRDVTAEKRAEAELRGRSDFERQLIGIVSHDLRIPLSVIRLSSQALQAYRNLDGQTSKMLARIQSAAERGARMVSDLLDFTQARVGGGIPVVLSEGNLHTILRQVVEDVSTTAAGHTIRVEVIGDGQGRWDLDRVSQILTNLLTNAISYSPPDSEVAARSESDADGVTVSIHNTGPAIPAAALPRIFDPLQRATAQLENRTRSIGLGLFIVKHLVEAHRGWIDVTSTAEAGTTFRFWVPRSLGAP